MLATRTMSRTGTAQAARYLGTRVLGDLLSIHEKFSMGDEGEMRALAHDVELGLAHDCLSELRLFLYAVRSQEPTRVYIYERVAAGTFSASTHSGRIARSRELTDGRIGYEVSLHDRATWDKLKAGGHLSLSWSPCVGRSIAGMSATTDGGYASGELGLSRTVYTR